MAEENMRRTVSSVNTRSKSLEKRRNSDAPVTKVPGPSFSAHEDGKTVLEFLNKHDYPGVIPRNLLSAPREGGPTKGQFYEMINFIITRVYPYRPPFQAGEDIITFYRNHLLVTSNDDRLT
eukprot:GHVU01136742.1.p1 GENE.GHVU01136742.1~~GHVU01136742.1.p1  ORF type:complete len:141 (+),score=0.18 GHVU01136742.1:63-425(+)